MARKKKQSRFTRGEKMLMFYGVVAFVFMMGFKIFCEASVSEIKMSIEQVKYNIDVQEKKNESLTMKVNELTSFENVNSVVKEMGLAYNNDNIIVVDK